MEDYLESYVDHFNLRPHFRLATPVRRVLRDEALAKWRVEIDGASAEVFDKVVMATGPHLMPMMPDFEGEELFTGKILHSKAFKR